MEIRQREAIQALVAWVKLYLHTIGDGLRSRFFFLVIGLIVYRSGFFCFIFLLIVYILGILIFGLESLRKLGRDDRLLKEVPIYSPFLSNNYC